MDLEILENLDTNTDKIKYLINGLENLYDKRKYSDIDDIIIDFVNYAFDFDLYLTFLSSTLRYRYKLKNINLIFKRTLEMSLEPQNIFIMSRYKPDGFDNWLLLQIRRKKINKLLTKIPL